MRLLYINNQLADIDEETAIGIDFQAYDLKDPAKRKLNTSNSFTIPKTANNLNILGNPDNHRPLFWVDDRRNFFSLRSHLVLCYHDFHLS